MARKNKEVVDKTLQEKMRKIDDAIGDVYELIETANFFSDGVCNELSDGMELPKKKKERMAFLKAKAKEKFPKIISQIEELDACLEGVGIYLDEVHDKLEQKQDIMQEVRNVLDTKAEYKQDAKILLDSLTGQFSVKIPKKIADKARLDPEKQKFVFTFTIDKDDEGNIERRLIAEVQPSGNE